MNRKDDILHVAIRTGTDEDDVIGFCSAAEAEKFCAVRPEYRPMRTSGGHSCESAQELFA